MLEVVVVVVVATLEGVKEEKSRVVVVEAAETDEGSLPGTEVNSLEAVSDTSVVEFPPKETGDVMNLKLDVDCSLDSLKETFLLFCPNREANPVLSVFVLATLSLLLSLLFWTPNLYPEKEATTSFEVTRLLLQPEQLVRIESL